MEGFTAGRAHCGCSQVRQRGRRAPAQEVSGRPNRRPNGIAGNGSLPIGTGCVGVFRGANGWSGRSAAKKQRQSAKQRIKQLRPLTGGDHTLKRAPSPGGAQPSSPSDAGGSAEEGAKPRRRRGFRAVFRGTVSRLGNYRSSRTIIAHISSVKFNERRRASESKHRECHSCWPGSARGCCS